MHSTDSTNTRCCLLFLSIVPSSLPSKFWSIPVSTLIIHSSVCIAHRHRVTNGREEQLLPFHQFGRGINFGLSPGHGAVLTRCPTFLFHRIQFGTKIPLIVMYNSMITAIHEWLYAVFTSLENATAVRRLFRRPGMSN